MPTNLNPATIFNPGLANTPLEDFTRLSRASDAPRLSSASGKLLETGGEVFADAVKVAHTITEQDLGDRIRNAAENERDPYNDRLAAALDEAKGLNKPAGGTVTRVDTKGNPIGPRGSLDILSQSEGTETPLALQNLNENLTSLSGAKANGKLSRTDYIARLDSLAKDFRADFPGWRDYIDKKFEQVTGMIPANALVQSRISDVNSFVGQAQKERDKITAIGYKAIQEGMPGAVGELQLFEATGNKQGFLNFIARSNASEWASKQAGYRLTETSATIGEQKAIAVHEVNKIAANTVQANLNTIFKAVGVNVDPKNPQAAFDNMEPDKAIALAQAIRAETKKWEAQIYAQSYKPVEGTKVSFGTYATAEEINKATAANIQIGLGFADYLEKKETGLAGKLARITQAWHESGENAITGTPELKDIMIMAKTLQNNFGTQAMPVLIDQITQLNLPKTINTYLMGKSMEAAVGKPDPDTGIPAKVKDDILQYRKVVQAMPNVPEAEKQKWIAAGTQHFLKQIYSIKDPTIPVESKKIFIERAFSPEGMGLLAQMNRDGMGPNGTKGRFSVFNDLADPKMTDAIKAVGGKHWEMYKDWVSGVWNKELLQPELKDLNSFIQTNPNIKLDWNATSHKFMASFAGDSYDFPLQGLPEGYRSIIPYRGEVSKFTEVSVGDAVNKLNSTLAKYKYVAATDGADSAGINAYVARVLFQAVGHNPKENVTADQFLRSVLASSPENKKRIDEAKTREQATAKETTPVTAPGPVEPMYDENRSKAPRTLKKKVQMPSPPNTNLIPEGL